ncbi:MAG: CBS domain-containing protein [Acidobacteriota bacterium]
MPHRLKVADIMSRNVVTLTVDDTLADARDTMTRGNIHHLPVVREGRLVGLVTHHDLLSASVSVFAEVPAREERQLFARIPVQELMHDAVTVTADTPIRDAGAILLDTAFGCLPVVDREGHLLGIVTETDYLRLAVRMLDAIQA